MIHAECAQYAWEVQAGSVGHAAWCSGKDERLKHRLRRTTSAYWRTALVDMRVRQCNRKANSAA